MAFEKIMIDLPRHIVLALLVSTTLLLASGCSKTPPKIVPVSGTILLNGQPLPTAEIRFLPTAKGLDANFAAIAVSDATGKFVMNLPSGPGATIGEQIVTVTDGPIPDSARGMSEEAQQAAGNFLAALPNRPIPSPYGLASQSTLRVTVVEGQEEYKLELVR
jgi:hypothetical protein